MTNINDLLNELDRGQDDLKEAKTMVREATFRIADAKERLIMYYVSNGEFDALTLNMSYVRRAINTKNKDDANTCAPKRPFHKR